MLTNYVSILSSKGFCGGHFSVGQGQLKNNYIQNGAIIDHISTFLTQIFSAICIYIYAYATVY